MKTKQLLIILLLLCALIPKMKSQRGSVSAGGDAFGSGGNVSYSIGQVDYITAFGSAGSAYQGIQQPFLITESTGLEEKGITLFFSVYPSPTIDNVTLKVDRTEYSNLKYTLMSVDGKILKAEELTGEYTLISMGDFTQGLYKVNVYSEKILIKSFNVIKN